MTLVCFAVKEEARPFAQALLPGAAVRVLVTGMGRANAVRVVGNALKTSPPGLVLASGFAGGLRPDLETGTVVFSATGAPEIEARLLETGAVPVRFHCAERVIATRREKERLRAQTGCDAVDMESGPVGALCEREGIPHAAIRVILDGAGDDLPLDFNRLMTSRLRINPVRLAAALAGSPTKVLALLALRNQSRRAAANLAEVLLRVTAAGSGGR